MQIPVLNMGSTFMLLTYLNWQPYTLFFNKRKSFWCCCIPNCMCSKIVLARNLALSLCYYIFWHFTGLFLFLIFKAQSVSYYDFSHAIYHVQQRILRHPRYQPLLRPVLFPEYYVNHSPKFSTKTGQLKNRMKNMQAAQVIWNYTHITRLC